MNKGRIYTYKSVEIPSWEVKGLLKLVLRYWAFASVLFFLGFFLPTVLLLSPSPVDFPILRAGVVASAAMGFGITEVAVLSWLERCHHSGLSVIPRSLIELQCGLLPARVWNEELGDALEDRARRAESAQPPWRVQTAFFVAIAWMVVHAVQYWLSAGGTRRGAG